MTKDGKLASPDEYEREHLKTPSLAELVLASPTGRDIKRRTLDPSNDFNCVALNQSLTSICFD